MKHFTHPQFWEHYARMPETTQRLADKNFGLLKNNPRHPSLHFKRVGCFWSVRVGYNYRALAVDGPEGPIWFWIGPHAEYDKLIKG